VPAEPLVELHLNDDPQEAEESCPTESELQIYHSFPNDLPSESDLLIAILMSCIICCTHHFLFFYFYFSPFSHASRIVSSMHIHPSHCNKLCCWPAGPAGFSQLGFTCFSQALGLPILAEQVDSLKTFIGYNNYTS
jgi:hypothetical protein